MSGGGFFLTQQPAIVRVCSGSDYKHGHLFLLSPCRNVNHLVQRLSTCHLVEDNLYLAAQHISPHNQHISPYKHIHISLHDHPFGRRNENASAKERECKRGSENDRRERECEGGSENKRMVMQARMKYRIILLDQ